ncbi:MAG: hypothetical protein ACR2NV_13730 [Thermoleophilaceae bacterium]
MSATSMYPLDPRERAAVRQALDEDGLDALFLGLMSSARWATRDHLQARVAGEPKYAAAVPRWLASARRRGLLDRDTQNGAFRWALTDAGGRQLRRVEHLTPPVRLSEELPAGG